MCEKMVTFKHVLEKYSKLGKARDESSGHKESQIREKLMEIVDAIGIDANLLRAGEKFNSPLVIPETSIDFLVKIIDWHTSTEAKALRKGAFLDVSAEKKDWIINGFINILEKRGYDSKTIDFQRQRMEHRLMCSLQHNLAALTDQLSKILSHVENLRKSGASHFTYEDQVVFADFATQKVKETAHYLEDVAIFLDEGRGEEIYDMAINELENTNDAEIFERELRQEQVFKAISQDNRYKELEKKRDALIAEEDFVKNKKGQYQKIVDEMIKIADDYEKKIFGTILPDEPAPLFVLMPPQVALAEALAYKEEADEERKRILSKPPLSKEETERIQQFVNEHFSARLEGDD